MGAHAVDGFEAAVEMAAIVETTAGSNIGNGEIGLLQESLRGGEAGIA